MIYKEIKEIESQKAHLLARLKGAKNAIKTKHPRKTKNLNPVQKTKFMRSNGKHLQNNAIRKSRRNSISTSKDRRKKGRGYHSINRFGTGQSNYNSNGGDYNTFRSSVFRSSVDPHEKNYNSNQLSGFGRIPDLIT